MEADRKGLRSEILLGMLDTAQENLDGALKLCELEKKENFERIQEKVHRLARTINRITKFLLEKKAEMEENTTD